MAEDMNLNPAPSDLAPEELRQLFFMIARALTFDALRLGKRERMLVLILAVESFAEGRDFGTLHLSAWEERLFKWRSNELKDLLADFQRWSWITVDVAEGTFRLAPDRLPGWGECFAMQLREGALPLLSVNDLNKIFAKVSQEASVRPPLSAVELAKLSQRLAEISHRNGTNGGNVPTFNRCDVKRLNVVAAPPLMAAPRGTAPHPGSLKERVRNFVGDKDWFAKEFWNGGRGWRHQLFTDESEALEGALNYCEAGLKSGEMRLRKTRGAMLWDEFQRVRSVPK